MKKHLGISIENESKEKLRKWCENHGVSMSQVVSMMIEEFLVEVEMWEYQ